MDMPAPPSRIPVHNHRLTSTGSFRSAGSAGGGSRPTSASATARHTARPPVLPAGAAAASRAGPAPAAAALAPSPLATGAAADGAFALGDGRASSRGRSVSGAARRPSGAFLTYAETADAAARDGARAPAATSSSRSVAAAAAASAAATGSGALPAASGSRRSAAGSATAASVAASTSAAAPAATTSAVAGRLPRYYDEAFAQTGSAASYGASATTASRGGVAGSNGYSSLSAGRLPDSVGGPAAPSSSHGDWLREMEARITAATARAPGTTDYSRYRSERASAPPSALASLSGQLTARGGRDEEAPPAGVFTGYGYGRTRPYAGVGVASGSDRMSGSGVDDGAAASGAAATTAGTSSLRRRDGSDVLGGVPAASTFVPAAGADGSSSGRGRGGVAGSTSDSWYGGSGYTSSAGYGIASSTGYGSGVSSGAVRAADGLARKPAVGYSDGRGSGLASDGYDDDDEAGYGSSGRASGAVTRTSVAPARGGTRATGVARGLVGLQNLGNTCFMNSCLQCLSNLPPLTAFFLSGAYRRDLNTRVSPTRGALATAYADLIARMWDAHATLGDVERPSKVKSVVGGVAPRFLGYDQHDAQEFLRFIVDGLHEDTNRVGTKPTYRELVERRGTSDAAMAEEWWRYFRERSNSYVQELFAGQLKTTVECRVCGHVSRAFDPFWDLALPIPRTGQTRDRAAPYIAGYVSTVASACSLGDCLSALVTTELLEGSEAHYCGACRKHTPSERSMAVYRLPRILVLQLKRFVFSTFRRNKLSNAVAFPLTGLDLRPYCADGSPAAAERGAGATYRCVAVSNHSGSLGGGHYTADCLNADTGAWYHFNDSHVSRTGEASLSQTAAYLLFYVREGVGE